MKRNRTAVTIKNGEAVNTRTFEGQTHTFWPEEDKITIADQPKATMYLEALAYRVKPPVKELDIEQGNELLYKYEGVSGVKASYKSWNGLMPVAKKVYEELNTLATPKSQFKASDLREGIRKALVTFDVHELWLMTVICVEFINDLKQVSVDHIIQVSPDGLS